MAPLFTLPTQYLSLPEMTKMPLSIQATNSSAGSRYQLKKGQVRLFHRLPSGLRIEVITQKKHPNESDPDSGGRPNPNPPLVFVHGSFHAAWCWAEHWLPFFSRCGYDSYAISLLGQVTLSLAAKAFANSLPLCKETFFSSTMDDHQVLSYQELMRESSKLPLFDLKKLNASLPVPSIPKNSADLLVIGASDDFIVDKEGLEETGNFFNVQAVSIQGVAHDMMLDSSWEKGAEMILSWLKCKGEWRRVF